MLWNKIVFQFSTLESERVCFLAYVCITWIDARVYKIPLSSDGNYLNYRQQSFFLPLEFGSAESTDNLSVTQIGLVLQLAN